MPPVPRGLTPDPVPWRYRPTSVGLVATVAMLTLAVGLLSNRHLITGDYSHGILPRRLLRQFGVFAGVPSLVVGSMTCLTMAELLLFGAVVMLAGVEVEKHMGSARFAMFLFVCLLARLPFLVAFGVLSQQPASWYAAYPSTAWLAVAIATARRLMSPPVRPFVVIGVPMCDQASTDFLAFQLCLLSHPSWIQSGLCGLLVALAAMSDAVGLFQSSKARVPASVTKQLPRPHVQVTFRSQRTAEQLRAAEPRLAAPAPVATHPRPRDNTPVWTDANVEALTELGFSAEQAREALTRARGDVQRASAMLLDGDIPHA